MFKKLKNTTFSIHKDTFIADSASLIGNIILDEGVSIWYGAVLRGDINYIKVGKNSNIQDNVTIHLDYNNPVIIGEYTSVGHNAVVHGCSIGNNCLIGMGAVILNGSIIGDNSVIAAGSVVRENSIIPANSLVAGVPARVKREVSPDLINKNRSNAINYASLWKKEYI